MKHITSTAHRTGTEFLTLILLVALGPSAQLVGQERTNGVSLGRLHGQQTAPQRLSCCRRLRSDRIPGSPAPRPNASGCSVLGEVKEAQKKTPR